MVSNSYLLTIRSPLHVSDYTFVAIVDHLFEPHAFVEHPNYDQAVLVTRCQLAIVFIPRGNYYRSLCISRMSKTCVIVKTVPRSYSYTWHLTLLSTQFVSVPCPPCSRNTYAMTSFHTAMCMQDYLMTLKRLVHCQICGSGNPCMRISGLELEHLQGRVQH